MYVDPSVVSTKVERELRSYIDQMPYYRGRGVWLLEYEFPRMLFAFIAKNHKPYALVLFGVVIDFSNYDVEPASVQFVDPRDKRPLTLGEMRRIPFARARDDGLTELLVQGWALDDNRPFLCLQGVREYHENPGHTGDSWWLHRGSGVGKLAHLLDLIARYGSEPPMALVHQLQIVTTEQVTLVGPPPT